jgi:hypothetical protein
MKLYYKILKDKKIMKKFKSWKRDRNE